VLAIDGRIPRPVRDALADCSDALALGLLPPDAARAARRPLKAVI